MEMPVKEKIIAMDQDADLRSLCAGQMESDA